MYEYSWELDPTDPMKLVIKHNGQKVMGIFLGEAIEGAGYRNVMTHVAACNRSDWLIKWQAERAEMRKENNQVLMDLIKGSHL